jgi:hypothetical protein
MGHWLYRYVFRGIGILLVAGMITTLLLAIRHIKESATQAAPAAKTGMHR